MFCAFYATTVFFLFYILHGKNKTFFLFFKSEMRAALSFKRGSLGRMGRSFTALLANESRVVECAVCARAPEELNPVTSVFTSSRMTSPKEGSRPVRFGNSKAAVTQDSQTHAYRLLESMPTSSPLQPIDGHWSLPFPAPIGPHIHWDTSVKQPRVPIGALGCHSAPVYSAIGRR